MWRSPQSLPALGEPGARGKETRLVPLAPSPPWEASALFWDPMPRGWDCLLRTYRDPDGRDLSPRGLAPDRQWAAEGSRVSPRTRAAWDQGRAGVRVSVVFKDKLGTGNTLAPPACHQGHPLTNDTCGPCEVPGEREGLRTMCQHTNRLCHRHGSWHGQTPPGSKSTQPEAQWAAGSWGWRGTHLLVHAL